MNSGAALVAARAGIQHFRKRLYLPHAKIIARRAALGAMREDGVLVLVLSSTPRSVNRICGAIWGPIFSCHAVAARCIGDAVRSSDPACSGPTWAASVDILVQASLDRDDWQLIELMAAGHGSCERSSCEKGEQWQLALALLNEMWEANSLELDVIQVIRQGLGRARRRPGPVRDVGGEAGARRHQPRHWPREAQAWPPLARRRYLSSSSSAAILILLLSCSSVAT